MRLNKWIAQAGVCARRSADHLILSGKILINDQVMTTLGYQVKLNDTVKYKGRLLAAEKFVYILLHKPKNTITTRQDPQGRKTVLDLITPKVHQRIYPVGRLDRNTTGLLLLTNDGNWAQKLAHPSFQITKVYHVTLATPLSKIDYQKIQQGIVLPDGKFLVDQIKYLSPDKKKLSLTIHSGKNRIIRRVFEHLHYNIQVLNRVQYGSLTQHQLPYGQWRYLQSFERKSLLFFKSSKVFASKKTFI